VDSAVANLCHGVVGFIRRCVDIVQSVIWEEVAATSHGVRRVATRLGFLTVLSSDCGYPEGEEEFRRGEVLWG